MSMDCCGLPVGVAALACAIARELDDGDLALLAALLVELGDTLTLILAQRTACR